MPYAHLSLSAEAVSASHHYSRQGSLAWWQHMRLLSSLANRGLVNRYSDRLPASERP